MHTPETVVANGDRGRAIPSANTQHAPSTELALREPLTVLAALGAVAPSTSVDARLATAYAIDYCPNQASCIVGRTDDDLVRAAWRLTRELGAHSLAPAEHWDTLVADLRPIAEARNWPHEGLVAFGFTGGVLPSSRVRLDRWRARSGLGGGSGKYLAGHSWLAIKALLPIESRPGPGGKLCVLDPKVQCAALQYARAKIDEHPDAICISMAVSDGGGWTDPCLDTERGMSPSDRQVWLANFVLDTLRKEGWQGRVAIQAYNECALAPSIRVDPCVIVVAMIRNGPDQLHYDEVVAGYRGAGATTIYPYEYVCVAPWNEGTPAPSHANHPEMMVTLAERIRAVGVGWAEACQQWCSSGRGYWVLSRLLDGLNPPSLSLARQLQDEYLNLAYGLAASAMGSYHATMDAMTSKPSDAEIAKLFSDLHAAWAVADAPVRRRLLDHFCYARYLQLYRADKQQKTLESFAALLRHVYRIEVTDCVPIMPLMAITWKTEVADLSRSLGYPADEPIRPRRSPWNDAPPTADEALGWGKP